MPVPLGSLGLDFFREVHQQARLKHRDRARRLADDALSYRAGAERVQPRPNTFRAAGLVTTPATQQILAERQQPPVRLQDPEKQLGESNEDH